MRVWTEVKRKGWGPEVRGGGPITEESVSLCPRNSEDNRVEIKAGDGHKAARVYVSIDEVRTVVSALRAQGIDLDPARERQRQLVAELAESFGTP
jgi:hypothetical protein